MFYDLHLVFYDFKLRQIQAQSDHMRQVADKIKQRTLIAKQVALQKKRYQRVQQQQQEEANTQRMAKAGTTSN